MTSLKIDVWWKKYLTKMQIIQFIIDVIVCLYCLIVYELHQMNYISATCNGKRSAAIFGVVLLASYLLLFVDFYKKSYKSDVKLK